MVRCWDVCRSLLLGSIPLYFSEKRGDEGIYLFDWTVRRSDVGLIRARGSVMGRLDFDVAEYMIFWRLRVSQKRWPVILEDRA